MNEITIKILNKTIKNRKNYLTLMESVIQSGETVTVAEKEELLEEIKNTKNTINDLIEDLKSGENT